MSKETLKRIPILGAFLSWAYWLYIDYEYKTFLRKNVSLKDSERGRRCFVIATGPSIKTLDLKVLRGEISISVSNFFVHPDFNIIRPKYHLFVPLHPVVTEDQCILLFKDAEKHFPEGQNILLSVTDKPIVEKHKFFLKQNVYYYYIGASQLDSTRAIDFAKQIPEIQTSSQIAIYIGLYTGCTEIYMLGCDHDWILHYGKSVHFYDEKDSAASRAGFNEWKDLESHFISYVNLWKIYKLIKQYAANRNITVYNSPSSLLDVFPKRTLGDFIESK